MITNTQIQFNNGFNLCEELKLILVWETIVWFLFKFQNFLWANEVGEYPLEIFCCPLCKSTGIESFLFRNSGPLTLLWATWVGFERIPNLNFNMNYGDKNIFLFSDTHKFR